MTSEIDVFETNEFSRRRKLRLQQVREQSKDIAKRIRQRAKVEKVRQVTDIDSKKEKEYIECQEKLVKRLELLYSKSLQNVGASHKKAQELSQTDFLAKTDLSKLRGKEAAIEVRKKKQEKLDEQKKLLDRKLQAREVANELSREKSANITKNLSKQTKKTNNLQTKSASNLNEINDKASDGNVDSKKDNLDVSKVDMATQWEFGELPNEWEPNIPVLSLPKDDTVADTIVHTENSDKNKKPNLFALSDEMPSSLRGGLSSVPEEVAPFKTSLNFVSEYLQNRNLRLRQFEPLKKPTDDLQSIKQTILRTRASRADGSVFDSICHVLDEQVIPVPSWQAEENISFRNNCLKPNPCSFKCISKIQKNMSAAPLSNRKYLHLNEVPKMSFRSNIHSCGTETVSGYKDKSFRSTDPEIAISRKKSVSVYNHNTRDIMDVPYGKDIVSHDKKTDEDAYAQAFHETASASNIEKEQLNKRQQDMRNKVAVTKQNVDKEYKDTLAFLNSLPKDNSFKPIKNSYRDDQSQQSLKEKHQRKLQQEFKQIEKECQKHNCKHNKRRSTVLETSRSKSKSPVTANEQHRRVFEYSWMPVPESDGNFAIHTIPTTTKNKSGNTVKFSEPNSYHEYRSRHKHTPPTKDNNSGHHAKKMVETVILQQNNNGSDESDRSAASETSSVENLSLERENNVSHLDSQLRDADRIIIYKVLNSRNTKSKIKKSEGLSNNKKIPNLSEGCSEKQKSDSLEKNSHNIHKDVSYERIKEGVYGFNSEGDNIASMYFSKDREVNECGNQDRQNDEFHQTSCCGKTISKTNEREFQNEGGDTTLRMTKTNVNCYCGKKSKENSLLIQSSAATSAASFKTAPNDKTVNVNHDSGLIKLIDDGGQEAGKFYIGASGFIKDDNYEVVIQLRKKDGEKLNNQENKNISVSNTTTEKPITLSTIENKQSLDDAVNSDQLSKNKDEIPVSLNVTKNAETKSLVETSDPILNDVKQSSNKEASEAVITETITNPQISNTCEKAVHTSFEDTYAIPIHVPKSDPISRPATSTYTQTSFNSSVQRPVFMHMSSSTSTAYMSPPELVLPKFLKQDYIMTHEDMFESENTVNQTDPQYEIIEGGCDVYEECRCKRCASVEKNTAGNLNIKKRNANNTPPNTARSNHSAKLGCELKKTKKRNCKCRKCKCNSEMKLCKSNRKRTKSENTNTTMEYLDKNTNIKVQARHQQPTVNIKENDDNEMNPILKTYIKKLLALNKEGLKAVEIMNQNCSSASTPGSSIINIPSNDKRNGSRENLENKISLEQIKNVLKQQILKDNLDQCPKRIKSTNVKNSESQTEKNSKLSRILKKKSVHKVKSLNISRQLLHKKKTEFRRPIYDSKIVTSTSSSTREEKRVVCVDAKKSRSRGKSSPTPRSFRNSEYKNSTSSDIGDFNDKKNYKSVVKNWTPINNNYHINERNSIKANTNQQQHKTNRQLNIRAQRAKPSYMSSDSDVPSDLLKHQTEPKSPTNLSTQTNRSIDVETSFMKVAEDKLQNMEKIADLTEKCTKRLSNLAKVLEEVRRNKSLVYSQISTSESASESDNKSDKNEIPGTSLSDNVIVQNKETLPPFSSLTIPINLTEKKLCTKDSTEYTSVLNDIPKPVSFVIPSNEEYISSNDKTTNTKNTTTESSGLKVRARPPPALSRISLKNGQEICVTPHELSTVIEVDSPMSLKLKNPSSRLDTKSEALDKSNQTTDETDNQININVTKNPTNVKESRIDPDLLQRNLTASEDQAKVSTDSSDDTKIQTLDINRFNDIMLKPFISLQEYAKQCSIGLEEGSNIEDVINSDPVNEDLSSLHSDGSLPDVIAELLKRNIISEPFKFDTGSNPNSTSVSSESTLSILALSKTRKGKKRSGLLINKENIADTSETLSISSNPDLENAFQKLGMGWASSTLKKTKERLALSSSSNTSSSSMAQFKIRSFSQVIPTLTTDSTSSLIDISKDHIRKNIQSPGKHIKDNYKNVTQQTSLTNSMTVKEFLTNELAKKITFSNKVTRKEADEEFVSLYETNMPDDMKHTNVEIQEDDAQSTVVSNTRARTSTPVQIFKSTTYNSTSSSSTSNGLFSNADDLSSVKVTSTSMRNHSTSDKDDLTIPNYSLKTRKELSDFSKSD